MDLFKFIRNVICNLEDLEGKISKQPKFSPKEMSEILQSAKSENVCFLESLSKINKLSAFDISFLLSSVKLDYRKVEIIKQAASLYREDEFKEQGQTFSDFIFKVASNIELLNSSNIELFKDLAKCKSDVYDFKNVLKNPSRYLNVNQNELEFAFEKVFY